MSILDPQTLLEVARRFQDSKTGMSFGAASPQVRDRTKYLSRNLAKAKASFFAADAAAKGVAKNPSETISQLAQERIIGSSDLVDMAFLELAIAVGRGVCRIRVGRSLGTGVLVGPGLVMTNHHVIESEQQASGATAEFDCQQNSSHELLPIHSYRVAPSRFFITDKELDFTIVSLGPLSDKGRAVEEYPWLPLIGQTGKAEPDDPLNIIQHPNGGLKQIAFRENCVISIPQAQTDFLYYTTDTEPGSSGSPCFNDQWELVALHHSAVPKTEKGEILKKDNQPWQQGDPVELIQWIANEGCRVSVIVRTIEKTSLSGDAVDLRRRMLNDKAPNPIELARRSTAPVPDNSMKPIPGTQGEVVNMSQNSVTLTVPLRITLSLGDVPGWPAAVSPAAAPDAAPAVVPAAPASAPVAIPTEAEEVTIDKNWKSRKGYDPHFLGFNVPLPALSAAQLSDSVMVSPEFRVAGDPHLLNYHHYSVKMSQKRRTAWFSAAMIDGTRFIDFKRGKDQWFLDPRILTKFQMGEELYAGANTDRGHLTRFKDLSWGANMAEAVNATNDSFHFTNCTLQLSNFNQSQDRWQGLEQYLLEQHAKKDDRKMVVITGPVLKSGDPRYRNEHMNYTALIPLAFWKVCVLRRQDGTVAATAFTLGQEDITKLPGFEEKLDISTAQVTIADLQKLTGLKFGDLSKHDVLVQKGPNVLEAMRPEGEKANVIPIEEFTDIQI